MKHDALGWHEASRTQIVYLMNKLFIQWALGWHEAWALVGLGLGLKQRGWDHGPYRWVEV